MKVLQEISTNSTHSGQETKEFLAKQLGVKDGEGSNIGSQCEERKIMGGSIFSNTKPRNMPLEYRDEQNLQYHPTMPKFVEIPNEYHEARAETIATWEEKFSIYQTFSEECRRDLPFRDFYETQYRGQPRGTSRLPYQNYELKNAIGKITLSYFDRTSKSSVSSWIQKMDTYF